MLSGTRDALRNSFEYGGVVPLCEELEIRQN